MTNKMKNNYWTICWGYLLCALLGHKEGGRFLEKGNELCDCGADHTYYGCVRCHFALDDPNLKSEILPRRGAKDPRDPVGNNPTGRARKSSAGRRGKAERRLDKDLKGTKFDKNKDKGTK